MSKKPTLYQEIIARIFEDHWHEGEDSFVFAREEIIEKAAALDLDPPKNIGDLTYFFRYRGNLPDSILATQPDGLEWIIEGAGQSKYQFRLVKISRVVPNEDLPIIDLPDATPELIRAYALDDEQALLAIVRYNRLIDTFLGLTTYSLQNHLRTTVKEIGQIEIDELYVGLDEHGCHYVIPVQAKRANDQVGIVQVTQDILLVNEKFPGLRCRAIVAQPLNEQIVALFELSLRDDEIEVVKEAHYRLVPARELKPDAVIDYRD